jgi:transcription initiation factor IIE alpha subunit
MELYTCHRCNTPLLVGEVSNEEYFASCPKCDEDMYEFECIKQNIAMENIREKALKY